MYGVKATQQVWSKVALHLPRGGFLPRRQAGFGYLLVLLLVALLAMGLGQAGTLWRTESQRIKETDLLFIGEQYRQAIQSYYAASPGNAKHYPKKLEDLLLDARQIKLTRHLRKLYSDPITGKNEWGLIRDADSQEISGVYSLAPGEPRKQQGFSTPQSTFVEAKSYEAWRFMATKADNTTKTPVKAQSEPSPGAEVQAVDALPEP